MTDFSRELKGLVMDIRKHVAKLPQRQDSLADQLADLLTAGNRLGLYDAVDWVREVIEDKNLSKVGWWVCCGIQYPLTVYRCTQCGGYTTEARGYELAVSIDGKVTLSLAEINICRQWFAAVQDINQGYLNKTDYILAAKIFNACGMRVPHSILDRCP